MSGAYRTYRGLHGECIRVPAETFATVPKLHAEPQPFPFARMADALGPLRDRFAQAVSYVTLLDEAKDCWNVRRIMATLASG